jgi:hypothetical protein
MASDDIKAKTTADPKKDPSSSDKSTAEVNIPKVEGSQPSAASYSRGEGQKAVSKAYKDNWDTIYGKKKKQK